MSVILQIDNLVKSFPEPDGGVVTILDIPSFVMNEGEQVALIGQSGGGKTTLLHLIAGLLSPDVATSKKELGVDETGDEDATVRKSSIVIDNIDLTKLSEQGRDRFRAHTIGYVFQTFNLLPAFTALENVRLGMTFGSGKGTGSRAMDLLDRVGLADRADYRPSQLSVGQQQRVAIARAMAGRPRLLLADEPTANVDPKSAEVVLDLIRKTCQEENVAMLMVTHDMQIASRFDRIEQLDQINHAIASKK